jgi:hypothetical protein
MKQLSTLGARRHFFRSPRRAMRPLRPGLSPDGLEDSPEMVAGPNNGFGYFSGKNKLSIIATSKHRISFSKMKNWSFVKNGLKSQF